MHDLGNKNSSWHLPTQDEHQLNFITSALASGLIRH
jgi:hypothetical protein